jgi:amidase
MSEFWGLTAVETADLVRGREASAVEVTRSALSRLGAVNPAINAVVTEMPEEAMAAAAGVDASIAAGDDPGPLAGVPVTIKVVADQMGHPTTNGLRIQQDRIAEIDSPMVANLRKAGAVIIGRTNTPAFSLRWFTRNSLHGHTLNPRNSAITPGGSSGGAAAAVAAGIGAIAHGSDIAGSIRYPAYACGVHGLRPTLGRVPAMNATGGDRNIGSQLMAVSGPIARTIADLRVGLAAMAAEDLRDPWWTPVPLELPVGPKRAALCVAPEGWQVAPEVERAVRDAASRLKDDGWEIEEVDCPPLREAAELQARLWLAEYRQGDIDAVRREDDPDASFVFTQMEARCPEPDLDEMMETLRRKATLTREWQMFLDRYGVLVCPVSSELPFTDLLDVESPEAFERVMEAQLLQIALPFVSLPALTVSTGLVGETPVGIQLVAGRYQEARLMRAGEVIERGGVPVSPIDPR